MSIATNTGLGDGEVSTELDMNFGEDLGRVGSIDTDFRSGGDGWVVVVDGDFEAAEALEVDAVVKTVADGTF